jgi:hypothetical protein
MVPAELMTGRIPMCADTGTQFPDLLDELLAGHRHQITIDVSHGRGHLLPSDLEKPGKPRCAASQRRLPPP